MSTPSARDLQAQFFPRPRDLPREILDVVREHSKRMFGNRDRLEVAVAISRVELGKVNATDLNRDVDLAVNRIRAQLLALESLELLERTVNEQNKRMFEVADPSDRFWRFVAEEYGMLTDQHDVPPSRAALTQPAAATRHPDSPSPRRR